MLSVGRKPFDYLSQTKWSNIMSMSKSDFITSYIINHSTDADFAGLKGAEVAWKEYREENGAITAGGYFNDFLEYIEHPRSEDEFNNFIEGIIDTGAKPNVTHMKRIWLFANKLHESYSE